jgi:hypothetical protein
MRRGVISLVKWESEVYKWIRKKKVGPQYCCYFLFFMLFFKSIQHFYFYFGSFKPFVGDHYTTCRKKWWWKLVLEDLFHWYRHHGPSKNNPYIWGLFLVTIHYPPYNLFKALKECIFVICIQSLEFRLQTIIQAWSLLIMDFWQVPWSLLVMKFVCILLFGYEIMHASCMVG